MIDNENFKSAEIAFFYAKEVLRKPWSQIEDQKIAYRAENIISKSAEYSYEYANEILQNRFEMGEYTISGDLKYSLLYSINILRGGWKKNVNSSASDNAEKKMALNIEYAYLYARDSIKGRFQIAEELISEDPKYAFWYAQDILLGSWLSKVGGQIALKAEGKILENEKYWDSYIYLLIKNKSEIDEPKIATQGKYAYRYARDILNGSWKEKIGGELAIKAEKSIANDPAYSRKYSHLFH